MVAAVELRDAWEIGLGRPRLALVLRQVYGRNDAARSARPLVQALIAEHVPAARAPR